MPVELFTVGAEAWVLAAVAAVGVAALPWSSGEVERVAGAVSAARGLLRVGVRWVRVPAFAPVVAR
jgi:hypothetical protein